ALIWWPGPLAIERLYLLVLMGAIVYAAFFAALIAMPMAARLTTKTAISRSRYPSQSSQRDATPISPPFRFSSSSLRPDSWRSVELAQADKRTTGNARRLICPIRRTLRRVVCGSSEGRRAPAETTRPQEARPRLAAWQTQWRPPARSTWRGAD